VEKYKKIIMYILRKNQRVEIFQSPNLLVVINYQTNHGLIPTTTISLNRSEIFVHGSLFFPINTYLTTSGNSFNFGTGVFTAECWFYLTTNPATYKAFLIGAVSTGGFSLYTGSDATTASAVSICIDCYLTGHTSFTVPTMTTGKWYHVAVSRDSSGYVSLWLNGVRSSTGRISNTYNFTSTKLNIGAWSVMPESSNGIYINDLRITNTNVYNTNNSSITVPTSLLASISGTQLLLNTTHDMNYKTDNSVNKFTMNTNGIITISSLTPF